MTHAEQIASPLNVKPSQVTAVINLLDEGNTVPFIARYRKEMTGSLDDEQIRIIADELLRLRGLDERVRAAGGTFSVSSPATGPTIVTAVLPCAS